MALHRAKIPFGWYPDGFTREALKAGDERDFGDATAGLYAAGMIEPVGEKPKKDLAQAVTHVDVVSADESDGVGGAHVVGEEPRRRGRPRK